MRPSDRASMILIYAWQCRLSKYDLRFYSDIPEKGRNCLKTKPSYTCNAAQVKRHTYPYQPPDSIWSFVHVLPHDKHCQSSFDSSRSASLVSACA